MSHVALTVPQPAAGPRVSDLVIVGRTEKLAPGELADDNVLAVSGMQLYPNLGEPLRKSVDRTLSFYFSAAAERHHANGDAHARARRPPARDAA